MAEDQQPPKRHRIIRGFAYISAVLQILVLSPPIVAQLLPDSANDNTSGAGDFMALLAGLGILLSPFVLISAALYARKVSPLRRPGSVLVGLGVLVTLLLLGTLVYLMSLGSFGP